MLKVLPMILLILSACGVAQPAAPAVDAGQNALTDAAASELQPADAPDVPPQNLRQPDADQAKICKQDHVFALNAPAIHFGKVAAGKHVAVTATIAYASACAMPIQFKLAGSERFSVQILGQTLTTGNSQDAFLLPAQTFEFQVQFSPDTDLAQTGLLQVIAGTTTQNLALDGNIGQIQPCLKISPSPTLNLGSVVVGETAKSEVKLSNCGNVAVTLQSMVIAPNIKAPNTGEFKLDLAKLKTGLGVSCGNIAQPLVACSIAPGAVAVFDVIFAPSKVSQLDANQQPIPTTYELDVVANGVNVFTTATGIGVSTPPAVAVKQGEEVIPQTKLNLKGNSCKAAAQTKYKWTVKAPPGCNPAFFPSDDMATPTLDTNCVGSYTICVEVSCSGVVDKDRSGCKTVSVVPNNAIHVELLWDTPSDPNQNDCGPAAGADLDLHFAHPKASEITGAKDLDCDGVLDPWFHNPFDTFWFNPTPQWGSPDQAILDDPTLDLDDTDGAGPENLNLIAPQNLSYSVGVHYWNDHSFGKSLATISIFIQGTLVTNLKATSLNSLDMWYVGKLNWPNQMTGGSLPPFSICYQTGKGCELGGVDNVKMWKAVGDLCITPCYVNQVFIGSAGGAAPANCKKIP